MTDLSAQSEVRHCLFRSAAMWFAVPATAVREVTIRPDLVPIPGSPAILAGICHFRNEFLATLTLRPFASATSHQQRSESQLMVLTRDESPWGLLVDEVVSLSRLEPSVSAESNDDDGWSDVIAGWATHADQAIRVLDPDALYDSAFEVIGRLWSDDGPGQHDAGTSLPSAMPSPSQLAATE